MTKYFLYLGLGAAITLAPNTTLAKKGGKGNKGDNKGKVAYASAKPTNVAYIEKANIDRNVRPQDNFYNYANGAWLATNPVPGTETRWGSFNILNDYTQSKVRSIMDEVFVSSGAKSTPEQMVGDFYRSGMDSMAIEKKGISAIAPILKKIDVITNYNELITHLAYMQRAGLGGVFGLYVGADDKDVSKNILNFFQGGLGLPDKDYYFKKDERSVKIQNAYKEYIAQMLTLGGMDAEGAVAASTNIYALETSMAEKSMGRVEMRDPYKLYNKMTVQQMTDKSDGFDWNMFIRQLGINTKDVIVAQPEFMEHVTKMLKAGNIEDWKTYLRYHTISDMAPYLSSTFDQARFGFYGKTLSGQKIQKPRWKRVSGVVNGNVGMQLGKIYVKKYFTEEAKQRMNTLVNNLQVVYANRIKGLTWMSAETKTKALEKLNLFMKKIGYPDTWKSYDGLVIDKNDYIQNILLSSEFEYKFNASKLSKPVDRSEWGMTPNTINAYYNPAYNEIVFPAGILQFPFFDFGADDAVNYGGIGAVIGHEMTHGFDDQGAQYAADGNLKDWWTETDKTKFKEKTTAIVNQYNNYTVLDTVHVNGELTQGENIADLGGVTIAYEAFKMTKQYKEGKSIDGFTPEQRFFMSWAQIWRANATPEETAQRIATDPHSPGVYRCNGPLTNFEPFYKAFNVKPGDAMYKAVKDRLIIW